ncbi:MAG: ribonuclease PH [Candidatus Lokiarchaeota archaeon]|nr:ribonuclease PH [Candidatus Lokiarchaeota archaeon]
MTYERSDGRKYDELRKTKITRNYLMHPEGSVLIEQGNTKIIITASVEPNVARWMRDTNNSWITSEYSMLPRATDRRKRRPRNGRHTPGRSVEIQRLIGRSLRAGFNLKNIGEISIYVDCDIIQADGGTRCASITGGFVAAYDALKWAYENRYINRFPEFKQIAAISVGIIDEQALLDLPYEEDSKVDVDMNFVMNEDLNIVEIQGTSEGRVFSRDKLSELLDLAEKGIKELIDYQKEILNIS